MDWGTISPEESRTAQILSGVTLVILLSSRFFGRYGRQVQIAALTLYLIGIAAFIVHFLTR